MLLWMARMGGRIRPAAAGPRRLQVSTGHLLKAAFRILCPPPPNKKPDLSAGKRIWEDGFVCISPLGDEIKVLPPSSQWQATVHWTVAFISFESAHNDKKSNNHEECSISSRRIRSPAGEPRRLQVSTGHLLKAAFRILCPPPPNKKPDLSVWFVWWGRTDSNHRSYKQQIYSLSPLATRELPHVQLARLEPVDGLEPPTY